MGLNITEIVHKIEVRQDPPNRVEIATVGKQGPKGDRGYSAYQVAVLGGYTGTEEEWLESLKIKGDTGDTGDIGPQGPQGEQGEKGDIGPQGPQGTKGDTGTGVPEITEGDGGKFLTIKEDETGYETRAFSGFPAATTSVAGLMSAADKTKLDGSLTEDKVRNMIIVWS